MNTLILIVTVSILSAINFLIGAIVGQKVSKNEDIKLPNINPINAYNEHKDKKQATKEQKKINDMLDNISNYNGTPYGQKNIE